VTDDHFISYPRDPTKMTILIGRSWKLWATRRPYPAGSPRAGEFAYWNIGARRWVELHGSSDPTVPVLVEEILGDDYAPEVTHYGWDAAARPREYPSMIHVRTGADPARAKSFLSMCFTYGLDAAVKAGDGKVVALRIIEEPAP